MQLCCVSDWPLRALSWQQSEGGTPGLPAPLNQEASAAPLYCTSGEFRLCSAFSFSIPLKLHRDLSCPPWKMGSTVFLVCVAFVFFGSEEKPRSTIPLHIYLFSPFFFSEHWFQERERWLPLPIPLLYFFPSPSHIYPLQANTCAALLSQTSLSPPLITLRAGPRAGEGGGVSGFHLWSRKTALPTSSREPEHRHSWSSPEELLKSNDSPLIPQRSAHTRARGPITSVYTWTDTRRLAWRRHAEQLRGTHTNTGYQIVQKTP